MKKIIKKWRWLYYELNDYKWFRKWYGGEWYFIKNNVIIYPFWSDTFMTSCQGRALKTEKY
jgi:hypothetical protein